MERGYRPNDEVMINYISSDPHLASSAILTLLPDSVSGATPPSYISYP
jgi:hypothetical protein